MGIKVTLTADKTELGSGVTALVRLNVRNETNATASVVIACALANTYGKESSRAWTSAPASGTNGISGNDASGTGALSDTVSIESGKEVTYYLTCTLSALGSYTHALTTLKATATVGSTVQDTKYLRLYQGDMAYVTFQPGVDPNARQVAAKLLDPAAWPEMADWLENNGGRTFKDLI